MDIGFIHPHIGIDVIDTIKARQSGKYGIRYIEKIVQGIWHPVMHTGDNSCYDINDICSHNRVCKVLKSAVNRSIVGIP